MTSTNMARLQDAARINCPGALDGMIRMETFNTLKEFLQRSDAWLLELPIFIVPNVLDYIIETRQNVVVNRLMSLERPRSPSPPSSKHHIEYPYDPMAPPQYLVPTQDSMMQEAQNPMFRVPRGGWLLNGGSKCPILRIYINPQCYETWIATFALVTCDPTDEEGFVCPPDWVMEKYLQYVASGVVCRMMLQPGKPYSSIQGAQYHGRKFNEGIGLARTEVRRMFTYGSQRWQYPTGWNSIRPRLPSGQMR